jgi:hypothetical protein
MNHLPPSPWNMVILIFFEYSQRYSQVMVHQRYQINHTVGKFATSVNDTGGKFATCVNDTAGKFATSVNNTGGKY